MLFVWGRNSDGQCGDDVGKPRGTIALPRPLKLPKAVVSIACGTGQQGCTFAVLEDGSLFTFGNNAGGRLGHPSSTRRNERQATSVKSNPTPRKVEALAGVRVVQACCSDVHAMCVTDTGVVYSWGRQGRSGSLGRLDAPPNDSVAPGIVPLPGEARTVDCESGVSAAV